MTSLAFIVTLVLAAPPAFRDPGAPVDPILPKAMTGIDPPWAPIVVDQCKARLLAAGIDAHNFRFSAISYVATRPANGSATGPLFCHVPQGAVLWKGATGINYYGFTYMSCAMTLALTRFEAIAQAEARRVWGRPETENPIRSISHFGTFNCRRQRTRDKVSQHSYGNALDIAAFGIKGVWGDVSVLRHWNATWKGSEKARDFLRSLAARLREEEVFTNVLDPDWDAGHKNHLHLDLAPTSGGLPSPALQRIAAMPTAQSELPTAPKPPNVAAEHRLDPADAAAPPGEDHGRPRD